MPALEVKAWIRSEMLDEKTCEICQQLDGIMLPADDPRWSGELGQLAHPNCRVCFVPIYDIGSLDYTTDIPDVINRSGFLQLPEVWDEYPSPTEGLKKLRETGKITIEEEMEIFEPYELMGMLLTGGG